MNDRIGGIAATAALAGAVILCCAGPLLVVAAVSLGVGAWLAAHGLWLLVGLALLVAGAALIAGLRRRGTAACAVTYQDTEATDGISRSEWRDTGRS